LLAIAVLLELLGDSFRVMYVKESEHGTVERGRYTLDRFFSRDDCVELMIAFQELFIADGRCNVWFTDVDSRSVVVYDQHDLIYFYGPRWRAIPKLLGLGILPGRVRRISREPHAHLTARRQDPLEQELVHQAGTNWEPLLEGLDTFAEKLPSSDGEN
jgi:hypothetical protein